MMSAESLAGTDFDSCVTENGWNKEYEMRERREEGGGLFV